MAAKKKTKRDVKTITKPKAALKRRQEVRQPQAIGRKSELLPQPASEIVERKSGRLPPAYADLLEDIKNRIRHAQVRAAVGANRELIQLYWDVGREIVQRQERQGWRKGIVNRLADDIQATFPGIEGFSARNVWRMRAFYLAYTQEVAILPQAASDLDGANLPQAAAEIPWFHNVVLIEKLKNREERLWYAQKAVLHGWSRAILVHHIELGLYERQGKAITNFSNTLPAPQSDLAQQTLKDPYVFDFLTLAQESRERDLEHGLLEHLRDFMLELGVGFAFVGGQYHIEFAGKDYYIDLLIYNLNLRAFVAIDLKVEEFKPEFAGKMSFYLSAIDDRLRHANDHSSVGIILCKSRDKVTVEYSLRDTRKPIGVSEYRLTKALPKELKSSLPSIEQLQAELRDMERK